MIAGHIHHALAQVHELQQKILEKQRFKGYSGRARALSGTVCLIAAAAMTSTPYPKTLPAQVVAWGAVFACAMLLNFGAMLYWFLFDPAAKRDFRRLKPVIDVIPPLLVGGVLTVTLMQQGLYSHLYGLWMCLAGLANLAMRHVLPKRIWLIGLFYIMSGMIFLVIKPVPFLNAWPAGVLFFLGEWAAGVILHFDESRNHSFTDFVFRSGKGHVEA